MKSLMILGLLFGLLIVPSVFAAQLNFTTSPNSTYYGDATAPLYKMTVGASANITYTTNNTYFNISGCQNCNNFTTLYGEIPAWLGFFNDSNIVEYWHLDNISSGVNGLYNFTVNGATGNVSGKLNYSYTFDGSNDYLNTTLEDLSSFSVIGWFNPNNPAGDIAYFALYNSTNDRQYLYWEYSTNKFRVIEEVGGVDCSQTLSTYTLPDDWFMLSLVNNGTQRSLYINDTLYETWTSSCDISSIQSPYNFNLGIDDVATGRQYKGSEDELFVWNKSVSQEDIQKVYNSSKFDVVLDMHLNDYNEYTCVYPCSKPMKDDSYYGNNGKNFTNPSRWNTFTSAFKSNNNCAYGNCIFQNNVDMGIKVSHSESLNFSTGKFTVCIWAKTATTTVGLQLMKKSNISGNDQYFDLRTSNNNVAYFSLYDGTNSPFILGTTSINNSVWHQICGVRNGTDILLYVDSVLENFAADIAGDISNNKPLYIGNVNAANNAWDGSFDEATAWRRALSQQEISDNYNLTLKKGKYNVTSFITGNSTAKTFEIKYYNITNQSFDSPVIMNVYTTQYLNVTDYSNQVLNVSADLVWNGTIYNSNMTNTSTLWKFNTTYLVASVPIDSNITFHWNINVTYKDYPSATESYSTTNQTVLVRGVTVCGSTYSSVAMRLFYYNEDTPSVPMNGTSELTLFMENSSGYLTNQSFIFDVENTTHSICIAPSNTQFVANATIQYTGTSDQIRFYFLTNITITNQTYNVSLYNINDTSSLITFKVVDSSGNPVPNVYIKTQRYYVGTNSYNLVTMAKTNNEGYGLQYLWQNNTWYKIIVDDGINTLKAYPQTLISTNAIQLALSFADYTKWFYNYNGIGTNCTFNSGTNNLSCVANAATGTVFQYCLQVKERTSIGYNTTCNTCQSSSSVTLVCNLGANVTGRYFSYTLTALTSGSLWNYLPYQGNLDFTTYQHQFQIVGIFLVFVIVLVFGFIGSWNPSVVVVTTTGGIVVGYITGLLDIPESAIVGFIVFAAVVIYAMTRS